MGISSDCTASESRIPTPDPGHVAGCRGACSRCQPALVEALRAQFGLVTNAPGTPNPVRIVSINNGDATLVLPAREGSR